MSTSIPGPTGTFHFSHSSGSWAWSDELFAVYGFTPGDVVPTAELMLAHQHPEDRAEMEAQLDEAVASGRPFSSWHRVDGADGVTRVVVTVGAGAFDESGTLVGVHGFQADVTESVRRTTSRGVDEAIELMAQSRPTIEQAKGALMLRYGLDAEEAFGLLRLYSQRVNLKLRDVARSLVDALPQGRLHSPDGVTWDHLVAELRRSQEPTASSRSDRSRVSEPASD